MSEVLDNLTKVENGSRHIAVSPERETNIARPGCVGLENIGNTCFLNAGIQCLFGHSVVAKYFIEEFKLDENNRDTLAGCFATLIRKCWSGKYRILSPGDFKRAVGALSQEFRDYQQQDCQEFLGLVLGKLHDFLNEAGHSPDQGADGSVPCSSDASRSVAAGTTRNDAEEVSNFEESSESGICMSDVCKDASGRVVGRSIQCTSEDSNLSDASAEDSQNSGSNSKNSNVLQKEAANSDCCSPNNNNNQSLDESADRTLTEGDSLDVTNAKAPSFEDICMKDARTLNTNVQLFEEITQISTDSEKFHKPSNINRNELAEASEKGDAELAGCSHLAEYFDDVAPRTSLELKALESDIIDLCKKGGDFGSAEASCKICNILADACSNQKHPEGKKLFLDLDHPDINNVKRIKVDDDGRQTKVNILQNLPEREPSKGDPSSSRQTGEVDEDEGSPSPPSEDADGRLAAQAQESWMEYLRNNKSIIVDTFQGQFKNTLNCSACNHTSVTFEPFMFLSLQIPGATQLQLPIIFLPGCGVNAVRYVVTVDKNSTVAQLKKELNCLLHGRVNLIIAEVHLFSILNVLEDQVSIKNIETKNQLYAFEDTSEELSVDLPGDLDPSRIRRSSNCSSPFLPNAEDGSLPSSVRGVPDFDEDRVPSHDVSYDVEKFDVADGQTATTCFVTLNNSNNSFANTCTNDVKLESNPDIDWQHNELDDSMQMLTDTTLTWSSKKCTNANWRQQTADWVNKAQVYDKIEEDVRSRDVLYEYGFNFSSEDKTSSASTAAVGFEAGNPDDGDRTGTCAICLEEMPLGSLKIHNPCGGLLCNECLEMSFKHASFCLKCPVCRSSVTPRQDFVRVNSSPDEEPRIITVNVMFRREMSEGTKVRHDLFGHPFVVKLLNRLSGRSLYSSVLGMLPCWSSMKDYAIVVTNAKGLQCSRCSSLKFCAGCKLNRDDPCVILRQGDNLVVHYDDLTQEEVLDAGRVLDDGSVLDSELQSPVCLTECFQSFMKSELLDRHNPWFCPMCKENQCAKRTMTVWKYPDTLIIQLKRFEFHNQSSAKIESEVVFPVTDLDLTRHGSNPGDTPLLYDLQSYVCHTGGKDRKRNDGHYVAFTKHPLSGEWFRYDDSNFERRDPSESDYASAYVLFYQRKDTLASFEPPQDASPDPERPSGPRRSEASLLKRGRTSSGSDLRRHNIHGIFLDDIGC